MKHTSCRLGLAPLLCPTFRWSLGLVSPSLLGVLMKIKVDTPFLTWCSDDVWGWCPLLCPIFKGNLGVLPICTVFRRILGLATPSLPSVFPSTTSHCNRRPFPVNAAVFTRVPTILAATVITENVHVEQNHTIALDDDDAKYALPPLYLHLDQ